MRTIVGGDPFGAPQAEGDGDKGLELDTASHASGGFRSPSEVARAAAPKDTTGLAFADNPFIVRCPIHDVEYDRRKADECRKCAAERRQGAPVNRTGGPARLRDDPLRRAFLGLAFALVVGLVPAAYSAVHVGGSETGRLRAQQEELSQKPGTEEVVKKFDDLDVAIGEARTRSMINSLVLWVLVSSGALAIWYKVT
jgi:hypothetical protein